MADMPGFGAMDPEDKGGPHAFWYKGAQGASPGLTPSQTVGPFFAYGLTPGAYGYTFPEIHRTDLTGPDVPGTPIELYGQVFDAAGQPVHDAMIELLQADGNGAFAHGHRADGFTGFGRCGTGADGPSAQAGFRVRTVKPGVSAQGHAPAVTFIVHMRGLLSHVITRMYFPDHSHVSDPILSAVPEARRASLIAEKTGPEAYRFDIHMAGPKETVFFDL